MEKIIEVRMLVVELWMVEKNFEIYEKVKKIS